MMSSRALKNQMQDATNDNLFQDPDILNNTKAVNTEQGENRNEIEKVSNDFNTPSQPHRNDTTDETMIKCDAIKDGKCEGEIKRYGNRHFNCLEIGQYHNFCRYHYDSATWCPAHPCFNKIT